MKYANIPVVALKVHVLFRILTIIPCFHSLGKIYDYEWVEVATLQKLKVLKGAVSRGDRKGRGLYSIRYVGKGNFTSVWKRSPHRHFMVEEFYRLLYDSKLCRIAFPNSPAAYPVFLKYILLVLIGFHIPLFHVCANWSQIDSLRTKAGAGSNNWFWLCWIIRSLVIKANKLGFIKWNN